MSLNQEVNELRQSQVIAKLVYDLNYRVEVTNFLEVRDFVSLEYREVYKIIKDSIREGKRIDALYLKEKCPDAEILERKDLFLDEELNYMDLAKRLHQEGNEYRIKSELDEFLSKSSEKEFDFLAEFETLQDKINQPLETTVGGTVGSVLVQNLIDVIEKGEQPSVGKLGIKKIDDLLGGLERGLIYSILAAPGVGKSMLGIQIFHESVKTGVPCMYVTNEMSEIAVVSRLVARSSGVASADVRRVDLTIGQISKTHDAMAVLYDDLDKANAVILDNAYDVNKAIAAMKYYVMKYGIKTIVVDHLHNFHGSPKIFERISYSSHALQKAAKELNIALIVLAQMDRASKRSKNVEEKTGKGADDLEEVSDVIMILNRKKIKEVNSPSKEEDPNFMQIIITKNREGKTGQTWTQVKFPSMVIEQDTDY